jgi:DNA-binding transcriptional LysR family regulator
MRILAYVDAVSRSGSIRKAAEQLHISSTSLNRAILVLERDLGANLFERVGTGVRLSAAGEAYVLFARRTLSEMAQLRAVVEDLKGMRRGRVSLGAIQSVAGALLPRAIAASQARHPGITFEVSIAGNDDILKAVSEEAVELGITFNAPPHRDITVLLGIAQSLYAVMADHHELAERSALRLHECIPYPLGLADTSRVGRQLLEEMLRRAGFRGAPALVSDSFELLAAWCRAGRGICFQIGIGAQPGNGLTAVPLAEAGSAGKLMLVARRGHKLAPPAAAFAESLAALLRGESKEAV